MNTSNFPIVRLGDTVDRITKGTTPTTHGYRYMTEGVAFVRVENLRNGVIDSESVATFISPDADHFLRRSSLERDDVLVSIAGTIGRTAVVREQDLPANTNQAIAIIRGAAKRFEPVFLRYALESPILHRLLTGEARGGAMQNISLEDVRNLQVPVPPLNEQRRIVAEIEKQFTRLEAGVAGLRRVQANLKRYRAAVLKAAVEGKLTEEWRKTHPNVEPASELLKCILAERRQKWTGRGKYKEPGEPDTTKLPPLPKGWTWARLEQLGFTFGGLTKNPKRTKLGKQLPYLRVANVYANKLRLEEIEYIGVGDSELEKLLLRAGDLLIVEGNGSKDQIGRLAIWDGSIEPCVHQNHVIKVRLIDVAMAKWILSWMLSPDGRQFVEQVASSTSGLYTLSVNKVGDLPIVLPPVAEQERIVAEVERRLSVVEELEAVVSANLQRATRLRQAVLQRAFEGKLVRTEQSETWISSADLPIAAESPSTYRPSGERTRE